MGRLRPAVVTIADARLDIREAEQFEPAGCAFGQCLDDFHAVDLLTSRARIAV